MSASAAAGTSLTSLTSPTDANDAKKVNVGTAFQWLWDSVVAFGSSIKIFFLSMPQIWLSIWAIIMIVAIALIGMGIMYMIYVLNPRTPGLNHIVDIDSYVSATYSPSLIQAIQTVASYAADASWVSEFDGFQKLVASANALVSLGTSTSGSGSSGSGSGSSGSGGTLPGDLAVYLSFRSSIMNNDNMITAADLRTNAPQFVKADGTTIDTTAFTTSVLNPLEDLWTSVGTVSGQLHDLGDLRSFLTGVGVVDPDEQRRAVLFATAVHQIRMMMDQVPAIEAIYLSSRPSKNAVWTVYYLPFMKDVFTVRIPSTWEHWPDDYEVLFETFITWWNDLGNFVTSFPMTVASMVNVDHFTNGPLSSSSSSSSPSSAAATPAKKETREGFGLGDLFSLAGAIANLMGDIGAIVTTFANIISNFASDPFGEFVSLLLMLLGILITVPLTILYFISKIFLIDIAMAGFYAFTLSVWWCVVYTLFLVVTVVLVAIPYLFLWILDVMTGGMISRLMRCENNPNGWYADPGFAEKNEYSSEPLSCWGPCSQRYKPIYGGTCCGARSGFMPDYCPQQQIYRIFSAGAPPASDPGPVAFVNYTAQPGFNAMTMAQRKSAIEAAYMQKVQWYQTCYDNMYAQDYLTRHLCDNVDVLFPFPDGTPPPAVNVSLSTVCKEIFCDYQPGAAGVHAWRTPGGYQANAPGRGGNGNGNGNGNNISCQRLIKAADANVLAPASPPGTDLLRQVLLVTTAVVGIMVSVRSIRAASPTEES